MTNPFLEYELLSPETVDPVIIRITGQREKSFQEFVSSNNVRIKSNKPTTWNSFVYIYIIGKWGRRFERLVHETIPLSDWPAVKQAIRELNEAKRLDFAKHDYKEKDMKKEIITYDSDEYYWIDTWVYGDKTGRRELTVTRKKPKVKVEYRQGTNIEYENYGFYRLVQFRVTGYSWDKDCNICGIPPDIADMFLDADCAQSRLVTWRHHAGLPRIDIGLDARDKWSTPVLIGEDIYKRLPEICAELERKANEVEG